MPETFVALGDSFTEGLDDPAAGADGFRGWADRVAEHFGEWKPDFRYANLAVRGRKLDAILDEQLPRALELRPELVSLAGGTNDVLRPKVDLDRLARRFDDAVRALRESGSQVICFQSIDPTPRSRLIGRALPRIKALTTVVEETAARYECVLVRLWGAAVFADPRVWSDDRLHLSGEGHARVAGAVLETLGLGDPRWAEPIGPYRTLGSAQRVVSDLRWCQRHLVPWIGRRLCGASSGDGIGAKRPDLLPLEDAADREPGSR